MNFCLLINYMWIRNETEEEEETEEVLWRDGEER